MGQHCGESNAFEEGPVTEFVTSTVQQAMQRANVANKGLDEIRRVIKLPLVIASDIQEPGNE